MKSDFRGRNENHEPGRTVQTLHYLHTLGIITKQHWPSFQVVTFKHQKLLENDSQFLDLV